MMVSLLVKSALQASQTTISPDIYRLAGALGFVPGVNEGLVHAVDMLRSSQWHLHLA